MKKGMGVNIPVLISMPSREPRLLTTSVILGRTKSRTGPKEIPPDDMGEARA